MCRGYYTRTVVGGVGLARRQTHQSRWVFDTNTPGNGKFAGQGNHNLSVADVDGDGKDEIIYGNMAVDDDGKGLYSTGIGHGDAIHVSDLDPDRPGLEVFSIQEPFADAGRQLFRRAQPAKFCGKRLRLRRAAMAKGRGAVWRSISTRARAVSSAGARARDCGDRFSIAKATKSRPRQSAARATWAFSGTATF